MLEANSAAGCVGVIAWMHTFSPAKMWIAGLDALQQAAAAPAHPGQHGAAVVDHRHGLHEPQPGRARRPRVRLHPDPARRRRARPSPATSTRPGGGRRGSRAWARAAVGSRRAAAPAAGPVRRQHARRRRHRGRQGRGRSCGSASRSTPTASTTWSRSSTQVADARRRRAGRRVRRHLPASRPSCCPAATGTTRCATAPASSSACARSSTDGGFGAFTTNFEDLGGLRQLPGLAVQRLMADGYGFGGEGDWKTVGAAARA